MPCREEGQRVARLPGLEPRRVHDVGRLVERDPELAVGVGDARPRHRLGQVGQRRPPAGARVEQVDQVAVLEVALTAGDDESSGDGGRLVRVTRPGLRHRPVEGGPRLGARVEHVDSRDLAAHVAAADDVEGAADGGDGVGVAGVWQRREVAPLAGAGVEHGREVHRLALGVEPAEGVDPRAGGDDLERGHPDRHLDLGRGPRARGGVEDLDAEQPVPALTGHPPEDPDVGADDGGAEVVARVSSPSIALQSG